MEATKEQNQARAKRRLYNKIKKALNCYRCQFLTLSFSDEILNRTSEATRERYIRNFLKRETAYYIANKDYGKKNKREHYHAFIIASTLKSTEIKERHLRAIKNQINCRAYKLGNISARFIATRYHFKGETEHETTALNITNHFYKDTTQESRIITSRNIPSKAEQIDRIKRLYDDKIKAQNEKIQPMTEAEIIADALKK